MEKTNKYYKFLKNRLFNVNSELSHSKDIMTNILEGNPNLKKIQAHIKRIKELGL